MAAAPTDFQASISVSVGVWIVAPAAAALRSSASSASRIAGRRPASRSAASESAVLCASDRPSQLRDEISMAPIWCP